MSLGEKNDILYAPCHINLNAVNTSIDPLSSRGGVINFHFPVGHMMRGVFNIIQNLV